MKEQPESVTRRFSACKSGEIGVSSITWAELCCGLDVRPTYAEIIFSWMDQGAMSRHAGIIVATHLEVAEIWRARQRGCVPVDVRCFFAKTQPAHAPLPAGMVGNHMVEKRSQVLPGLHGRFVVRSSPYSRTGRPLAPDLPFR